MAARKPQRGGPKKKTFQRPGRFWIYALIFVGLLFAIDVIDHLRKKEIVPYSQIKADINAGRIAKVWLDTQSIRAETKGPDTRTLTAVRVEDADLTKALDAQGVVYEANLETGYLRDFLFTWVLPIAFLFFLWRFVLGNMFKQGPPGLAAFGKSKARLVGDTKIKTSFKDVAGCDEAKEELKEIIDFLKRPEKFRELGGHIPKGVLLVGPPGTGKTLLARAVAGEASVPFFQISGSDFVEMFVGVGAARVRDLFQEAQKNSPCIVFIDELDAIAKSRSGAAGFQGNDEREQTLNQILVEMDGFDNHGGVIIMAATNRPEVLDPAILRPGRFDRQIVVDRPDLKGREEILKVHAAKIKLDPSVDLRVFAARTPGFSGADLANVVNEAALLGVRKDLRSVTKECLEEAIDRVVAGLARKSRVINEKEKRTIAVHEVGHALVGHFTPGSDKIHRISIVPRSSGALGFTMQIPIEDRNLLTESELKRQIRVLLGGRAAEKIIIGEVSSGAHDDLKRASQIVRRMVTEFGMGQSLGLMSTAADRGYLDNPFVRGDGMGLSDDYERRVDEECGALLATEFAEASKIIETHRMLLMRISDELLKKETLEADDFERLVGAVAGPTSSTITA